VGKYTYHKSETGACQDGLGCNYIRFTLIIHPLMSSYNAIYLAWGICSY